MQLRKARTVLLRPSLTAALALGSLAGLGTPPRPFALMRRNAPLAATSPIVLSNCQMGPERMIDPVAARAPDGFQQLEDVVSPGELEAIAGQYRKLAGLERERLGDSRG